MRKQGFSWICPVLRETFDSFLLLGRLTINCNKSHKNIILADTEMDRVTDWGRRLGSSPSCGWCLAGGLCDDSLGTGSKTWVFFCLFLVFCFVEWQTLVKRSFLYFILKKQNSWSSRVYFQVTYLKLRIYFSQGSNVVSKVFWLFSEPKVRRS